MKRSLVLCLALVVALPLYAGSGKKNSDLRKAKKKIPDRYIVVFEDRLSEAELEALSDDMVRIKKGRKDKTFRHALKGFVAELSEKAAIELAGDPRVKFVEEDGEVTISATQSGATWGLDRIDQRDLPLNSTYTYNYTGAGVRAYIIDTGILATHSEFGGRVVAGFTAINDGRGTTDCNGHGTHVAGTVGGSTYGVAKGVTLVPVRVLDCNGSGTNSGVIAGVDWVTGNHAAGQPAVANMSLGGGASSALDAAVNNSINDGVTYAVASGNSNTNACNSSPARVPNAITVNSSTSADARSSFSNFGTCTDIFAPGSSITSAWYTSNTATNTISGTSMATPHVTGVAALYLHQNGNQPPATVWAGIRDNSTPNKITSPGSGSPNRLLYSLLGSAPPPPPPPPPGGQLLLNPGFELGNNGNWTTTANVIDNSTGRPPRSGSWKAWLCGYGMTHTDEVYQSVTIPSIAASATLTFWIRIDSSETTTSIAYDRVNVQISTNGGASYTTLATYSNLNENTSYVQKSFDLTSYRGQTIRVRFLATEDSSLQTSFVVDDTALNIQ
jgi:subtilisin family serine protease